MRQTIQQAYELAKDTRERAYAPYSGFKVGAALLTADGDKVYTGCNVENASYGATICAERNAILHAIAEDGIQDYEAIIVVSDDEPPAPPCALCLQVLTEFCSPDMRVILGTLEGIQIEYTLKDLLPHPFDGSKLQKG